MADKQTEANSQVEFAIQQLYAKDVSFESPSPRDFGSQWAPEVKLDIQTSSSLLNLDTHEVVLSLTTTVKNAGKTAFLIEVKYAGIFTIKGLEGDALKHALGSYCPTIVFPYAREVVADLAVRGGFPQLNLAPINFDALFAQYQGQGESNEGGRVVAH